MKIYEMVDIIKAVDIICSYASASFRELATIQDAAGRYSYGAIYSPSDYPYSYRSRMDGFACRSSSDFTQIFSIIGDISAADKFDKKVDDNCCVRIATGAIIPEDCDLVVKVEDSNETQKGVFLHKYDDAVYNIEKPGSVIPKGRLIVPKNVKIDYRHIETLATLRINSVYVKGMKRIGILSTGSEITSRFSQEDMTMNSNYYAISSLLKMYGVPYANLGVCTDDKEKLKDLILSGVEVFDALISFGGTAFSRYDLMKEVLGDIGGHVIIDGLNASPGKTFRFGMINNKPFFIFPGTPQAALICGEFLLTPWLRTGCGVEHAFVESFVDFEVNKKAGFYKLIPCFSKIENANLISYDRDSLIDASNSIHTVILIPPEVENISKGSKVKTFIVY